VGLETYNHLLRQAVLAAKGQELVESPAQVSVNLPLAALLPPEYIPEERLRLRIYQQLAAATTESELDESARNLRQRFGPRPKQLDNLLLALRVRLLAAAIGAQGVETDRGDVVVTFEPGHGLPLGELLGSGPAQGLEPGHNRFRLRLALMGDAWPELLISTLRRLGVVRSQLASQVADG
jgi:transcription-repair coupling factor (superfamily II helicase)